MTNHAARPVPGFPTHGHRGDLVSLKVWCRWCCEWHTHSHEGYAAGHVTNRVAHCRTPGNPNLVPSPPYPVSEGYWIEVQAAPFSEVEKLVKESTTAQRRAMARQGYEPTDAVRRLRAQRLVQQDTRWTVVHDE